MPETFTRPPGPEIPRDFTLYGALSKAWTRTVKAADGTETTEMLLSGVASSSVRDRQGDTITAQCQAMMLEQLQSGIGRDGHALTMFLNHEYKVPEDVLGNVNESRLTASAPAGNEDAIIDLEIVCRVTGENERAVKAWRIVNDGVSLGFSVGGRLTEYEVDEENDDGESWCPPLLINGFSLWEISLCGIPANPRAYTEQLKTASVDDRNAVMAAAQKFMREIGMPDEAPAPTHNWARDMRAGLVRRASRSQHVREALRDELAAAPGEPALLSVNGIRIAKDGGPRCDRGGLNEKGEPGCALEPHGDDVMHLAVFGRKPVAGEAQCGWKDGCEQKNAAGSLLCDEHTAQAPIGGSGKNVSSRTLSVSNPDDADYDPTDPDYDPTQDPSSDQYDPQLSAAAQAAVTLAIGSLKSAMDHGMCPDALKHAKKGHHALVNLLTPGAAPLEDPENPGDPEDETSSLAALRALSPDQRKAFIAAAEAIAKDASLLVLTGTADLDAQFVAKRADLAKASAERDAATAAVDDAKKTLADLNAKIELAKNTPLGRFTAGGSGGANDGSEYRPAETLEDAKRRVREAHARI
jgi:phage head maturation protease